jgi:UDPglucose 6-dehydrogenase
MKIKNICCIGAGYVGGPTMAVIALKCPLINIYVVDANTDKIKAWNGPLNSLPIFEPGLADVIEKTRGVNLFFSDKIAENIEKSEMIFIAVNTPTKTEGEGKGMAADLSYIEACAKDIAKYSKSDKIVVEKSTVPIRTAEKIKEILEENSKNIHFEILSNPEFLAEGSAISDMKSPDRVLIGGDESESGKMATQSLVDIYANWIDKEKILTTNVWSSELAKLASNAILAQRVSSINSLSALCEKTGANVDELSKAIGMDHRIGPHFLKASVGFGGSCFKKDILNLVYLCKFYGLHEVSEYWLQVVKINEYQKDRFAQKIIDHYYGDLNGKSIAILGWAFKANTNDSRESPAIYVAEKLYNAGANLEIYDPEVFENTIIKDINSFWIKDFDEVKKKVKILDTPPNFNKIDISTIITEWSDFKDFDYKKTEVFDGRNLLGYSTYSIGKN